MASLIEEISMGPFGSNVKTEYYVELEDGIPILNGSNLEGFELDDSQLRFFDRERALTLKKSFARPGDVIITHRGTLGQSVYVPKNTKYSEYLISQSQFKVRCNSKLMPEYLVYYLHSREGQYKLLSNASQVGVPSLAAPTTIFKKMTVPLPPVHIQKKIVDCLNSLTFKIKKTKQINDNLATLIDVIFKETKRSSDCQLIKLSELCTFISRGVSPKYNPNSDYYVLGQTCVRNHMILMSNARTLEDKSYGQKQVQKWDIMVNSTGIGSLGRVAQVGFDHPKLVADSHITIVRPKECYREYLGCQLVSMENEIENMAEGSTGQTELPRSRFSEIEIPVPSIDALNIFSIKVRPLINMIYQNLESIKTLEQLRDYLLPKLMSGEIDVSTLEIPN